MNDEQIAKIAQTVKDGFGYPFHDSQSRELTGLNRSFEDAMAGVVKDLHDEFIEIMCGNCEYMCNDTHCGIRKTD